MLPNINSVQLLQNFSVTASDSGEKLMRVIRNPVAQYFPVNSRIIGARLSSSSLSSASSSCFPFLESDEFML